MKKIDNAFVFLMFVTIAFVIWLAKTFDNMIQFWPFFCFVSVPLILLSFAWIGFILIGCLIYFLFCGTKAFFTLDDFTFN